jgi:hypothetical protein
MNIHERKLLVSALVRSRIFNVFQQYCLIELQISLCVSCMVIGCSLYKYMFMAEYS